MWIFLLQGIYAIKIVTSPWEPMVNCEIGSTDKSSYTGYSIDLFNRVSNGASLDESQMSFQCMSWDDMIDAVIDGNADISIAGVSITNEYLTKMRFSTPIYDSGLILVIKIVDESIMWIFFKPFDYTFWITILISIVLYSHIIWMLERKVDGPIQFAYRKGILESLWHSFASLVYLGGKEIRTLPGRMIQIMYWFVGFVLIAAYTSNLIASFSVDHYDAKIKSYLDIPGKKVGCFERYQTALEAFQAKVKTYSWENENAKLILDDLKDGTIDVAALPHPIAFYFAGMSCDYRIVGDIFIPDYIAFAFPIDGDQDLYNQISYTNLELYEHHFHQILKNKNNLASNTTRCDHTVSIPLELETTVGIWITLAAIIFFGILAVFVNKRFAKKDQVKEEEKISVSNRFDNKTAAELDLISKFERILGSSEQKFSQKMKDLESAMGQHNELSDGMEDSLKSLTEKLEIFNNK